MVVVVCLVVEETVVVDGLVVVSVVVSLCVSPTLSPTTNHMQRAPKKVVIIARLVMRSLQVISVLEVYPLLNISI